MDIWSQPVEAVLGGLKSGPQGLAGAEAARRLAEFGPNRIEPVAGDSLAWAFAREFTGFFALILWLAAALAFVADHYQPGQGMGQMG
ncbi:MAG TPA: cation-transporting P-type ATPase [Rhodocyclaceae bacterium]|nr:cation-transporting P-type ATPase [Rhodocyclaceae bacterium]